MPTEVREISVHPRKILVSSDASTENIASVGLNFAFLGVEEIQITSPTLNRADDVSRSIPRTFPSNGSEKQLKRISFCMLSVCYTAI